eukprot:jgi/Chlat1/2741/Chrsp187S02933
MSLLRTRVVSFLCGFGTAGAIAIYSLQKDVTASHQMLAEQARRSYADIEMRLSKLEKNTSGSTTNTSMGQTSEAS